MVQEGPFSAETDMVEVEGGHLWCIAAAKSRPRSVAILIHNRWKNQVIQFQALDERICFADVMVDGQLWRLISAHLPHSVYPDAVYEATLAQIEDALPANRRKHLVAIGCDANAEVGEDKDYDDPLIVGKFALGSRSSRGSIFSSWAHTQKLSLVNTMFEKPPGKQWTHRLKNSGHLRQIDYLLIDRAMHHELLDSYAFDVVGICSDHRWVWAKLGSKMIRRSKWRAPKSNRGWKITSSSS